MKTKTVYVCTECGAVTPKWSGKCTSCGEWNTLQEEIQTAEKKAVKSPKVSVFSTQPIHISQIPQEEENRILTGIAEFDRVLGGGIVQGSLVLVSGEPGIGKSTILLQICSKICRNRTVLYVSGEESPRQIKMRAERLGVISENLFILPQTDIHEITARIETELPDMVIIDSIQTMEKAEVTSSPGSITQVKECTSDLMRTAKTAGCPIFIVGHVNKEGSIAGPKVLEHMVDAVLYFEGERFLDCRILRAVKNRFGSTNEIGVFEMTSKGLVEVDNPSKLFLQGKPENVSGIATVGVMEGSRPIIAEIQALVTQTPFPSPRRIASGFDYNRLNLIIAVLEKRCGFFFGNSDTYLNIIGGLRISEPAADLAVATALASSLKDFIIPSDTILLGEIGLAGEVRTISGLEKRVLEAEKLGYTRCIVPKKNKITGFDTQAEIIGVSNLREVFSKI